MFVNRGSRCYYLVMFTTFFKEMFSVGLPLIENKNEDDGYFYAIGENLSLFSNAVLQKFPEMKPVLLNEQRDTLLKARDEMPALDVMGFIKEFHKPNWKKDLPESPLLIGVSQFLSRLPNEVKADLVNEMYTMIKLGGYLLVGDLFIPQTIGLFEPYLRQISLEQSFSDKINLTEGLSRVKSYLRDNGRELCLPETMYEILYEAGFKSVELVYKKMLFGFIIAKK